ncbi:DegV family protein [Eubacterium limosum]|uniref:DegV family protein n=1 Tax=Eubacterium limosum TaxID=1736 RepID=UPI00372298C2
MKTIIITDSNCDLNEEYLNENMIPVIPFHFNLNGKDYIDDFGRSISHKEFYDKLRKGEMSTTAQITPFTYEEVFKRYVLEGYSIIYIGFSSKLSGSFNNSLLAQKSVLEELPSADITVIDSKSASIGQGMLVCQANDLLKQGKTKYEIIEWIENTKRNVNHWFTIDSLEHLKRGGRITSANAAIGSLLSVKPVLNMLNDGSLNVEDKVRGRKKSLRFIYEEYKKRVVNPEKQTIFIAHGDCREDAEYLKTLVMNGTNPKKIEINQLGPIIGSHTGPGAVVLTFIGEKREV